MRNFWERSDCKIHTGEHTEVEEGRGWGEGGARDENNNTRYMDNKHMATTDETQHLAKYYSMQMQTFITLYNGDEGDGVKWIGEKKRSRSSSSDPLDPYKYFS